MKPAPKSTSPPAGDCETLLQAATEARQAERGQEAIGLYDRGVQLKPDYVEGYWYQGTSYYTLDDFVSGHRKG